MCGLCDGLNRRHHDHLVTSLGDLTGAGRAFCSGDDLKDLDAQTSSPETTQDWVESIQNITRQIMGSRKIVIAAVHGWTAADRAEIRRLLEE